MIGGLLGVLAVAFNAVLPYVFTLVAAAAAAAGVYELAGRGWALLVVSVGALLLDYQREHHRTRR